MRGGLLVRPGLTHGARPERSVTGEARGMDRRLGRWLQSVSSRKPSLAGSRSMLKEARAGARALGARPDEAIDEELVALRRRVRNEGLNRELTVAILSQLIHHCEALFGFEPHDEQLFAAWALTQGHLIEMQTGEGKTITAAIAAIMVALAGVPVFVVTANDYLVERDATSQQPLFRRFGQRVGFVRSGMDENQRRLAYEADVTYCSNKQLIWDYLRDAQNVGHGSGDIARELGGLIGEQRGLPLLRGLCFALVDEADSAMIDDARTPMIISRSVPATREVVTEATVALGIARSLDDGHFTIDTVSGLVTLEPEGLAQVRELTARLQGRWQQERYALELVRQALSALHVFRLDQHYIVTDDKVRLVDEGSGRVLEDRKLQHGLHRMLEVKEGCSASPETEALAALSFQRFFPRFMQLAGMSGTLWEAKGELSWVYGCEIVRVPPHRKSRRKTLPMRVFASREDQCQAALEVIEQRRREGQPVLVGTRTIHFSETLSSLLAAHGIEHELLNARQDADEAAIVARAGRSGSVVVATNMAGRGTDIPLTEEARAAGGLHVLCLELNDSARVDRQLFGRAARQGDPGSVETVLSLEDELVHTFTANRQIKLVSGLVRHGAPMNQAVARWVVRRAQRACEKHHTEQRRRAFEAAASLAKRLEFGGDGG